MLDKLQRAIDADRGRNLPKRFYKQVTTSGAPPAVAVLLDERAIKTPKKADLAAPTRALADAVAGEWHEQDEHIDPARMPLTRLCNTAIDRVSGDQARIVGEIVEFAGSDLICYRADQPEGLVARQNEAWDPLLAFAGDLLGGRFETVSGVMHHAQPAATLKAMEGLLAGENVFTLTALHNITTLTGSSIIALAVARGHLSGDAAWAAAHIDEDWQIERWGEDAEAAARRAGNRGEFDAALKLLELLGKD